MHVSKLLLAVIAGGCVACSDAQSPPDGSGAVDMSATDDLAMIGNSCRVSVACPLATPICDATALMCRSCSGPGDDAECFHRGNGLPRCNAASGSCVTCRRDTQDTDCTNPAAPVCGSDGSCRPCLEQSECGSNRICNLITGRCAGASEIAYVDNRGMAVATCKANGSIVQDGNSPLTAYCDIGDAVADVAKPNILVYGSAQPYRGFSVTAARSLNVVGPGAQAALPAVVVEAAATAVSFAPSATGAALSLDGMTIGDGAVGSTGAGVVCAPSGVSAKLTVQNSLIRRAGMHGIDANNCAVTVLRTTVQNGGSTGVAVVGGTINISLTTITQNGDGGLLIGNGTQYTVLDNMIIANTGTSRPGVSIDNGAIGDFLFNTVAANTLTGDAGGVNCGASGAQKTLYASIVWGNSTLDVGGGMKTQFGGNKCVLSTVITGTDSYGFATTLDPEFVDSSPAGRNYRLKAPSAINSLCCIDKIFAPDGGAPSLPTFDVDGTPRPKGAAWDVGAFEAQ